MPDTTSISNTPTSSPPAVTNPNGLGLSRSGVIENATVTILNSLTPAELDDHHLVEQKIIVECQLRIEMENTFRGKGNKWPPLFQLTPQQIATIINYTVYVVRIIMDEGQEFQKDLDVLAIYNESGPNEGIYTSLEDELLAMAKSYNYLLTKRDFEEVKFALRSSAVRVHLCRDERLVPVNNGIFNYETKQLLPFDPHFVFLTKSRVNYNPNASNITIHNDDGTDWDVESWMHELSDDPEIVDLLWKILGAIIRPNVPWNKAAWFYSESGNNGKGTLCELMRQLCGPGSYVSIPLSEMGNDFKLEPLIHASAIIVDENDVGTFIDKAANLKALITGDSIMVNRKHKVPIPVRFKGFMVQCLNEMPRVKDKSDSFFRRQLFVPFTKCFTGVERKYIKNDYLMRKEVLEYVMYRVLNMNYYELPIPQSCADALEDYKEFVDPVRAFLVEMMPQFVWDLLPYQFLYDLYITWYRRTSGGDRNVRGRASFIKDVRQLIPKLFPQWQSTSDVPMRSASRIDKPEPLINEYDLKDWMNPRYIASSNMDAKCTPLVQEKYKGLYRS